MKKFLTLRTAIYCILIIILIFSFFIYKQISQYKDPQEDYASFLINTNNQFVKYMYDFTSLLEEIDDTDTRDEDLAKMSELVVKQNDLAKMIKELTPSEENSDYIEISDSIFQLYLFEIQGEIYLLEEAYVVNEDERNTTYIGMGNALSNTMGDVILQLPDYINSIRNTDYEANYVYVPADVDDPNSDLTGQINTDIESIDEASNNIAVFEENLDDQISDMILAQEDKTNEN